MISHSGTVAGGGAAATRDAGEGAAEVEEGGEGDDEEQTTEEAWLAHLTQASPLRSRLHSSTPEPRVDVDALCRDAPAGISDHFPAWRENVGFVLQQDTAAALERALDALRSASVAAAGAADAAAEADDAADLVDLTASEFFLHLFTVTFNGESCSQCDSLPLLSLISQRAMVRRTRQLCTFSSCSSQRSSHASADPLRTLHRSRQRSRRRHRQRRP